MKKILYIIPFFTLAFASCGGGCNNSTAEGAADCFCGLIEEQKQAEEDKDEDALSAIDDRGEAWEDEVDVHIENGDYTATEFGAAMLEAGCR
jgi:hypothetical protein